MARERGSGVTPPDVVRLLKIAIAEKGLLTVAAESGVGKSAISRYSKGIGEPTSATLKLLADFFGVSVWELENGKHWGWDLMRQADTLPESVKDYLEKLVWALSDEDSGQVIYQCINMLLNAESDEHLLAYQEAMLNVIPPKPRPQITSEGLKALLKRKAEEINNPKTTQ